MDDARLAQGSGPSMTFNESPDVVWAAAVDSIGTIKYGGFRISSASKDEGFIYIERGPNSFSLGENISIFITPTPDKSRTRVEIIRQPNFRGSKYDTVWDARLFKMLDERLRQR